MNRFTRRAVNRNRRRDEFYMMKSRYNNPTTEWYVYIVQCADGTYYTGITTDLDRRLNEHNVCNKKGAKYTRTRRPVELIVYREVDSRSAALSLEAKVKKLPRARKIDYLKNI